VLLLPSVPRRLCQSQQCGAGLLGKISARYSVPTMAMVGALAKVLAVFLTWPGKLLSSLFVHIMQLPQALTKTLTDTDQH
jgi:hypothetical protein